MRMFQGDLDPDLEVTLSDPDVSVDTTSATVRVIGKRDDVIVFDRAPTSNVLVGNTSVITMAWQPGDTDEVGRIAIEVEVTWPGVQPQTFRPLRGVKIRRDFDN